MGSSKVKIRKREDLREFCPLCMLENLFEKPLEKMEEFNFLKGLS